LEVKILKLLGAAASTFNYEALRGGGIMHGVMDPCCIRLDRRLQARVSRARV